MDELELAARVRAGLEDRATGTDVTVPVLDRVREEVAARRRTRRGVGAAAAAVLLLAGGVAVLAEPRGGGSNPPAAGETRGPAVTDREGLRTEYWGAVAVDVPADWGFGGAPYDGGTACYPEAMVGPDGDQLRAGDQRGWVGRPVGLTDVCASVPRAWEPTTPYVWLGADVETGTHEYDNGYVQESVVLAGTSVTVGSDDPALRAEILASAREGWLCDPLRQVGGRYRPQDGAVGVEDAVGLRVCAYTEDDWRDPDGVVVLAYAAELGRDAVRAYQAALEAADEPREQCPAAFVAESNWVVLEVLAGDGSILRRDVVHLTCPGIDVGATSLLGRLETVTLTEPLVEPWAVGGIPAVVHSPNPQNWMWRYFIGPQG